MPSRARRITAFYAVTFVVTHLITAAYRLRGGSWNSLDTFVVANGIMLVPGLVALIFTRWIFRQPVRRTLGLELRPNRWWLAAWLLPPALMLLTLGVSLLVPGTSYDPTMSVLAPAILHGTADGTVLLTLALVRGGGELTTGWGSLSCIAVLAVVDVGLFWTARGRPSHDGS